MRSCPAERKRSDSLDGKGSDDFQLATYFRAAPKRRRPQAHGHKHLAAAACSEARCHEHVAARPRSGASAQPPQAHTDRCGHLAAAPAAPLAAKRTAMTMSIQLQHLQGRRRATPNRLPWTSSSDACSGTSAQLPTRALQRRQQSTSTSARCHQHLAAALAAEPAAAPALKF